MKKILSFFFAFAAAFLMGSCNNDLLVTDSTEDGILQSSNKVTVNIEVAGLDGPSTKAIKQGWVSGDLVKIWFNYTTASQLPQLILTRNDANDGWNASELSPETVSGLQQSGGKFCVLYEASNSLFNTNYNPSEFSLNKIEDPGKSKLGQMWLRHTPMVCIANDVEYTFDGKTLSAVIAGWEFATQLQVVVTGIDKEDAEDYAMAVFGDSGSKEGYVIGAMVHTSENKLETTSSSYSWVGGVPNADGVAFSFAYLSTAQYGTPEKISLYNTKTGVEKVLSVGSADLTTTDKCCKGIKVSADKFSVPGALPGKFSVSATKKVHFSQGNLYYDGSAFKFETDQYEIQASWSTSHVSHFYWSKTASVAYAENYSDSGDGSDVFFTNQNGFKVNVGGKDQEGWRTLSKAEWQYLFKTRTNATRLCKYGVSVCDKADCLVIAPDGFTGTIETSYDASSWPAAEAAGLVCLPAAGYRNGSSVSRVGFSGNYWSSSPSSSNRAIRVDFDSSSVFADLANRRDVGYSVRLITE